MGDDGSIRERETLRQSEMARIAGARLARSAVRWHFFRSGLVVALSIVGIGASNAWLPQGWVRSASEGILVGLLVLGLLLAERSAPVRAKRSRTATTLTATVVSGTAALGVGATVDSIIAMWLAVGAAAMAALAAWTMVGWRVSR